MDYFAYGSNMNWGQMQERCPSAEFIGLAMLKDHRLAFTRHSTSRDCGVADVVFAAGSIVWGVIYQVDNPEEIERLDRSEGYKTGRGSNAYNRQTDTVYLDGDERRPIQVEIYRAVRQGDPPWPNSAYLQLILDGARFWKLPKEYIEQLEKIEVNG
jgi:hypothetical protein